MSAREVIARACTPKPDECYHGSASFSLTSGEFHCLVKMWERELPRAGAIISALQAAGYAILSPDEVRGNTPGAAEAFAALDLADRLIESAYGTDTPREWNKAFRQVAKARSLKGGRDAQ